MPLLITTPAFRTLNVDGENHRFELTNKTGNGFTYVYRIDHKGRKVAQIALPTAWLKYPHKNKFVVITTSGRTYSHQLTTP